MKVLVVVLLTLLSTTAALGCNPAYPMVCQAYTRAEAVFVGTLLSVDDAPDPGLRVDAHFSVEKVYKGNPSTTEVIRFIGYDNCGPLLKKIGEKYFVYKEAPSLGIANRTSEYYPLSPDVQYAEGIARQRYPVYSITGQFVSSLTKDELAKVSITITDSSGNVRDMRPNENGRYELTVDKTGNYAVRVKLPFSATVYTTILNSSMESHGKTVDYTVTFRANDCDYREFQFSPEDSDQK